MPVFTKEMIAGVRKHKYSSIDTSPFSKAVMHPFWDYSVKFCPKWVSPNSLTVGGFCLTVLNFLLLVYYDSNLKSYENVPDILWFISAILIFMAHFLDGIDGKQARRLGLSSPLGEILDHCCDSWTASLIPAIVSSIFSGVVSSNLLFQGHWLIVATFVISHWEKCLTGVLYLPWSYDIGQLCTSLLFLTTFLFSPSIWTKPLPIINISTMELIPRVEHVSFWIFSLPVSLVNIALALKDDRAKRPTILEFCRPLVSNLLAFVLSFIWMCYSPSNIMEESPRLFLFCVGTLSSHATTRIIIHDISKSPAPMWFDLMSLYAVTVFAICFGLSPATAFHIEYSCLQFITFIIVFFHLYYLKNVVQELCAALNLKAFSV